MQLRIRVRSGGEVKWAGIPDSGPVYYGGPPPESGIWKISTSKVKDYFNVALKNSAFGDSIETFTLAFEIAELEGWGTFFTSTSSYASYRPSMKLLVSVGQLNWPDVKDLSANEQFQQFSHVFIGAIARVSKMRRKPRNFDSAGFLAAVARLLAQCSVESVSG